jgi:hypothetical protein
MPAKKPARRSAPAAAAVRTFGSGATRNIDATKLDPEGFLSPLVLWRFAEYMGRNRLQADGSVRASDNWQKGIPLDAYAKGLSRHTLDALAARRGLPMRYGETLEDELCAVLFNAAGWLFELEMAKLPPETQATVRAAVGAAQNDLTKA